VCGDGGGGSLGNEHGSGSGLTGNEAEYRGTGSGDGHAAGGGAGGDEYAGMKVVMVVMVKR
jgi:hypothetical protein